jgi:hypothetical protein
MKILLVLSLIVNVILGVLYYQEKSQPPIERIILEQKPTKVIREEVLVPVPTPSKIKKKKADGQDLRLLDGDDTVMSQDYEEAVENIETSKREYLTTQLGISEDTLKKEGNLRSAFIRHSNKVYEKYQMQELPIAERRQLLDLEEKLQQNVIKLYGKSNWEKFQKYQLNYNKQVIKRVKEDNAPAILMGP